MKNYILIYIALVTLALSSCSSSKYTNYLKDHTEVVDMEDSLRFTSLSTSFYNHKLFLLGEVHEVETSPRIDYALFTQLNNEVGIDIYLAEMDIAQGYYLQKYLEGSNEISLKDILKNWPVYIGSISQQCRNKWKKMRAYYKTLPETSKFKLIGIDRLVDFNLLRRLLTDKLHSSYHSEIPKDEKELRLWITNKLPDILASHSPSLDVATKTLLQNILYNVSNYEKTRSRDTFMYENFKRLNSQNQWTKEKIYGNFGFSHTLQAYSGTVAGKIKKDSTLGYTNSMVSINTMYVDCKLTVESAALPRFMQDKGQTFTRFNYSQDNRLFLYVKGIADYKKVTKPHSISLIQLNGKDSPYLNSTRGTQVKKLITIWEGYDIIEGTSTTDYAQYILLVRNADWITPDSL